jgi:hypothetical protein
VRGLARDAVAAHTVGAVVLGVGWWLLAPDVLFLVSNGTPLRFEDATLGVFGVDAAFMAVAAVVGLVVGRWLWGRHQDRQRAVLVVLAAGGLVGAVAGRWLGSRLGPGPVVDRAVGLPDLTELPGELVLRATAALVVWPLLAVLVATVALWLSPPEPPAP